MLKKNQNGCEKFPYFRVIFLSLYIISYFIYGFCFAHKKTENENFQKPEAFVFNDAEATEIYPAK